ncbi:hypothetical protein L226DRAFT_467608 [Lentinus tigrinus ALCF2SS1-7]|uniref:Uncharacterized protein n=1 Tax=Lentinus tigrinus ALCF2SS1-6 TaxID=1328759 RepID=A0A5C2S1I6_9APHY|nr:hypothetical protein L227DRAFT_506894 [Lentinus tigrinus ALCF2SS1-6]RPD72034.1 hypothetical protein L226DRAFT_467608 [Lentinus tigrinus ALCF2SS1-7]
MVNADLVQDTPEDRQDTPEIWDWEIVQDDWWKTSFRAISWTYKTKPAHPRPPHYHDHLARGRRRKVPGNALNAAGAAEADVDLNTGLSGVQAAEDVLKRYEVEVAILPSTALAFPEDDRPACSEHTAETDAWNEKVRELFGGILVEGSLPEVDSLSPEVPLWDLDNIESAPDLTDSEASVESDPPPSTPKATKATPSYASAVSGKVAASPGVLSPFPSKLLNSELSSSALDFVPSTPHRAESREPTTPPLTSSSGSSDSPFSSPTYNFHFPSLNATPPTDRKEARSAPVPPLRKLENGFYVEETDEYGSGFTQSLNVTRSGTPRRASTALFPAFLNDGSPSSRSRNSKTREIVDRLRSGNSGGRKAKKANRKQASKDIDLTALITEASKSEDNDGWIVSKAPSSSLLVTDDGWIIQAPVQASPTPASQPKHKHGHKRSSVSSSSTASPPSTASTFSPASSTTSLMPPTPASTSHPLPPVPQLYSPPMPYAPYGPTPYAPAPAAYMQMQYPSARAPWAMGYQPGMYPMYQSFGVMPAAVPYGMVPIAPLQPAQAFYDAKGRQ